MIQKHTKIVCTIGPASERPEMIEKMVQAGMNVTRLNFSHGNFENFSRMIENIRKISKRFDVPIAILQDLQGPKIRVGEVNEKGITVKNGQKIVLTIEQNRLHAYEIPVLYKDFAKDVKPGDSVLIDDGMIELEVIQKQGDHVTCIARTDGIVKTRKGINLPQTHLRTPSLTEKDRKDLDFGLKNDVDYIALSFVRTPTDIMQLKQLIQKQKSFAKVIAKIERPEAVKNLEKIVQIADAVMVARGDLGIEIPAEEVPLVQKRSIHLANRYGKPVITATHILQSMVENPRPTRAEISDAANAVFDHSDALMLSNETAVGKYPVEAVETLAKVSAAVEKRLAKYEDFHPWKTQFEAQKLANATSLNAVKLARDIQANLIIAVTGSGYTAEQIARHRLYIPIITITQSEKVRNQLALTWGLNKIFVQQFSVKNIAQEVRTLLMHEKLAKKGERAIVVVNASREEKLITTLIV